MKKNSWIVYLAKVVVCSLLAACALGTNCATDVKHNVVSGALGFVEGTTGDVLDALLPIEDMLANLGK